MAKAKKYIKYFDVSYKDLCEGSVDFPEGVTKVKIIGRMSDVFLLDEASLPKTVTELAIEGFNITSFVGATLPEGLVSLDFSKSYLAPVTPGAILPVGAIDLSMCANLETLELRSCGLRSINVITAPPQLINLDVRSNPDLNFLDLTKFDGLKSLVASGCGLKEAPRGGGALEMLSLSFKDIHSLQEFDFSEYSNLREFGLCGNSIKELDFAKAPPSLEILILDSCRNLKSIDSFAEVHQLRELYITCSGLESLPHHEFPALERLTILDSPLSVESLYVLEFIAPNLTFLNFMRHNIGESLPRLHFPENLSTLVLNECNINSIEGVEWPKNLSELYLDDNRLTELNAEGLPNSLKRLSLCNNARLNIDLAKISSSISVWTPRGEFRNGEMEAVDYAQAPKRARIDVVDSSRESAEDFGSGAADVSHPPVAPVFPLGAPFGGGVGGGPFAASGVTGEGSDSDTPE